MQECFTQEQEYEFRAILNDPTLKKEVKVAKICKILMQANDPIPPKDAAEYALALVEAEELCAPFDADDDEIEPAFEEEDEDFCASLIPVNDHQIACDGAELIDMLNYSESVDEVAEDYFKRLGLTYTIIKDEILGFDTREFNELSDEKAYLLTFPEGTDLSDFDIVDLIAIEEISQETYNSLYSAHHDEPCDGDCENCPQDCIGKQPID